MNWLGKRVLVTGAGGFIGSHLTERLVELGTDVRAFVHYNALGSWGWLDQSVARDEAHVFGGDVTNRDSIKQAMQGSEMVFHLAALIAIPYSYQAPLSYVRTNFGLSVVTVRPFNTFGPRQSAHAVLPTIITQLFAGQTVHLGSL